MTDKYYDIDLCGTALNFSERIGEEYDSEPEDEFTDDDFNNLLLAALEKVGYKDIDLEKLSRSLEYYLTDGQYEEDIYLSKGYFIEYPEDA